LKVCDLKAIADIAKKHNIISACDNTFPTSYLVSPLLYGFDICMNSATKFIGGHADLIMGTLTTNNE